VVILKNVQNAVLLKKHERKRRMKRSKIVDLIIKHYSCYTDGCSNEVEYTDHAETLLDKLEEAGMLLPVNPTYKMSTIQAGEANEWEPEND
jgi:hypothetical protein